MVLDLCAAPGGKTSHLAIIKNNKGIIVSNEISRERSLILSSNIERMGFNNVIVTNNTIDDFKGFENSFDRIILDAPCSGSGMFRKESKMKEDWSYGKVTSLSKLQKELIIKAYSLLKPGGTLVYSTCSFSYEEDEEVFKFLLEKTNAKLSEYENHEFYYQSNKKIGIHLFPHLFPGEGHYICKIEKPLDPTINIINRKIKESNKKAILIVNKIYLVKREKLLHLIDIYQKEYNFEAVIPISSLKEKYRDVILDEIEKNLKPGPAYYNTEEYTDQTLRQLAEEIIREKALTLLQDEVPHGIYVEIEKMKFRKNQKGEPLYDIEATIYCLRNSHKGIIIGKEGAMLKRIGQSARIDMERNFGTKVNLKTWVKVRENWLDDDSIVKKFKLQ